MPAGVTQIAALAIGGGGSGLQVRPYDDHHNYYSGVTSSVSGTGVNLTANGGTGSAGGCGGSKHGGGCGGSGGTGVMAQCATWTLYEGQTAGQLGTSVIWAVAAAVLEAMQETAALAVAGRGLPRNGGAGGGGASVVNIVTLCKQNCGGGGGVGLYGSGANGNTEGSGGSSGSSGTKGSGS